MQTIAYPLKNNIEHLIEEQEQVPETSTIVQTLKEFEQEYSAAIKDDASSITSSSLTSKKKKKNKKHNKTKQRRRKNASDKSSSETSSNSSKTAAKTLVMKKADKSKLDTWKLTNLGYKKPSSRNPQPVADSTCRPCKFHARGYCKHGSKCRYSHDISKYVFAPSNNQQRPPNSYHYNHNNYQSHNINRASSPPISPPLNTNLYPSYNITPNFNNNSYASLFSNHNTPSLHPPHFNFPLSSFNTNYNHNIQQISHCKPTLLPIISNK